MPKITLAAARVNAGYTQEEAARALQVAVSTVQNWEAGKNLPRLETAERLCKLYKMPYDCIDFMPKK